MLNREATRRNSILKIFSGILFLLKDIISESIFGVADSSLMSVTAIIIFLDNDIQLYIFL